MVSIKLKLLKEYKLYFLFLGGFVLGLLMVIILARLDVININGKTYAYVNTEKVVQEVKNVLIQGKANDEEVKDKLTNAKGVFNKELENYTRKNNAIIFSSKKVIKGAKDITNEVVSKVIEGLL